MAALLALIISEVPHTSCYEYDSNTVDHHFSHTYMYTHTHSLIYIHIPPPSNPDHPLSRLLGEFQLEVFTLLKPVHVAVEKAGGLPRLNISLQEGAEEGERDGEWAVVASVYR